MTQYNIMACKNCRKKKNDQVQPVPVNEARPESRSIQEVTAPTTPVVGQPASSRFQSPRVLKPIGK